MKSKKQLFLLVIFCFIICTNSWAIRQEKVVFKNGDLQLAGTIYFPKGEGPFPAVVFIHGSGPETRKNSSYSAKWMASIGYIALTYDKRGAGKSDGVEKDWNRFNFEHLASDVVAATNFLKELEAVDKTRIGLHASSQGGWVAPLAASKTDLVSFMIIKSASVSTVSEDRIFERSARLRREKFSTTDIEETQKIQLVEAKSTSQEDLPDDFTKLFDKYKDRPWFPRVYGSNTDPFAKSLVEYRMWYATIADFGSVPYLEKLDIPVFWIFGDPVLDQLGPVEKSIATLNELKKKGKPYEIVQYKGEGHNIDERKYELALYKWLKETNSQDAFKFKRH